MPTYHYKCPKCRHEYETLQRITDNSRAKCPECGARGERQISAGAGLIFKGSGFYVTDYKKAGPKDESGAETGAKEAKKDSAKPGKPPEKPNPTSKSGADS